MSFDVSERGGPEFRMLIVNADGAYYAQELTRRLPGLVFDWALPGKPLPDSARSATALACFASALTDQVLDALPHLRWLQALSSGVDGLIDHPKLRGEVMVTSAHGIHGPAVSEMALMLMLALARDFGSILDDQRARRWHRRRQPLLHGKTLVIVGTGAIARELALKCGALGMRVVGVTATPRVVPGFDVVLPRTALQDAAGQADFLVLLTPLSDQTQRLVDAEVLGKMRASAHVVNLARGALCDTDALTTALREQRLAGAALDVFEREPLPADDPLWEVPRLIITPHLGGESDRYADMVLPLIAANVDCVVHGPLAQLRNRVR